MGRNSSMAYRYFRLTMLAISAAAIVLGVTIVAVCAGWPLAELSTADAGRPIQRQSVVKSQPQGAPLVYADFAGILEVPLQRPLRDPPPEPQAIAEEVASATPPPRVDAILLGTAVETLAEYSMAWIRATSENRIQTVRIDDILEGLPGRPKVTGIEEGQVILSVRGHEIYLSMEDNSTP